MFVLCISIPFFVFLVSFAHKDCGKLCDNFLQAHCIPCLNSFPNLDHSKSGPFSTIENPDKSGFQISLVFGDLHFCGVGMKTNLNLKLQIFRIYAYWLSCSWTTRHCTTTWTRSSSTSCVRWTNKGLTLSATSQKKKNLRTVNHYKI